MNQYQCKRHNDKKIKVRRLNGAAAAGGTI
jgi:hypothetical protein